MSRFSTESKRVGYGLAVGINVLLLVVVNNILGWGWFPWLTPEFEDVLPIINLALAVNIVLNLIYMAFDEPRFKAVTQILVNLLAIAVLVRMFQIYPFDFSAHEFPVDIAAFDLSWDLLTRLLLGLAIFETSVAVVMEVVNLFREAEAT